ncbi:TPA: hypothetical protein ACH3X1_000436 [Trebouxia sp. C0004]
MGCLSYPPSNTDVCHFSQPPASLGQTFLALVQTVERGRLVLSLAVIATLAGFMVTTVIKHKHYLYEQQPHSHGKASAEGVTRPIPQRLTLLQLLTVTDTDDLDAMAANFFRTATDDYLHDLLRKSENRALEAEGQTWHNSQRVRTLEQQKFQDKQSEGGLAQKNDSLAALLRRTRQEKRQVEDRLHGAFIHVSSLEAKAARAKQLHAAELSDVISNLELSKQDLAHSEQAHVAEADNSASLTATLQSLKSFCDSQTHKLNESCADLHISDHLRRSSEQRLEGVTAQRDRLADQVDSLRNGNYAQDREVRAVEFKCVTLHQQLAEALSGKAELALYAEQLTAEKLTVCGQLLQVTAQKTQLASERTVALTEKANGRKQLQRGNDDLSAQLAATLSGKAAAEQHAQQLQADHADLSAQLTAALSGKAAAEQHAQQLQAGHADLSAQLSEALAGRTEAAEQVQELQAGSDSLSAQLVDALTSGSAAQKQLHQLQTSNTTLSEELATTTQKLQQQKADSTSLHAELTVVSARKQGSERQLALLGGQNEELQHQLTLLQRRLHSMPPT